jgi:hypothetical protein
MTLEPMFAGIANSPATELTQDINATDATFEVSDGNVFPAPPNLAVIGTDENAETILYGAKSGNVLSSITRGVQGAARAWHTGDTIARNWTEKDHAALRANITSLNSGKLEAPLDWGVISNTPNSAKPSGYGITDVPITTTAAITKTVDLADLQAEIDSWPKVIAHQINITVNPGEISTGISISGFVLQQDAVIIIKGAVTTNTYTHKIKNFECKNIAGNGYLVIDGFTVEATDAAITPFFIERVNVLMYLEYCSAIGAVQTEYGFRVKASGGVICLFHNECTNRKKAFVADGAASVLLYNASGSGNAQIYEVINGARLSLINNGTITGTRYSDAYKSGLILPPVSFRVFTSVTNNANRALLLSSDQMLGLGSGIGLRDWMYGMEGDTQTSIPGEPSGLQGRHLLIMSDDNVYISVAANTLANRRVLRFRSNGNIEPLVTESFQLGTQNYRFLEVYAKNGFFDNLKVENGTWTPVVAGSTTAGAFTYASRSGTYKRIGSLCYVTCSVKLSAITTAPAGILEITGLPFTASPNDSQGLNVLLNDVNFDSAANVRWVTAIVTGNKLRFYQVKQNAVSATVAASALKAASEIIVNGVFSI